MQNDGGGNLLQNQLPSDGDYSLTVLEFMALISTEGAPRRPLTYDDHPILSHSHPSPLNL